LVSSSGRAGKHHQTDYSRPRHPPPDHQLGDQQNSQNFFTVVFACTSYLLTGQFVVGAFEMILLLFIVDFVALTLSTDNITGSQKRGSWKIKPLVELGFVLGLLNCAEAFTWFFIGKQYFPISGIEEIHSFGFAILFFTGIINILVLRTPIRFYQQSIGKVLLFTVIADALFAILILTFGIHGFTTLSILITGGTLVYFLICGLLINDWIKVRVNRRMAKE
jgi:H+-transporting ATPase